MTAIKNKKIFALTGLIIFAGIVVAALFLFGGDSTDGNLMEVSPAAGHIKISVTATGAVEPENRLEVKPPVAGRIERILVREGDYVKEGQIVAWMSSTERAAILDAARSKGKDEWEYWSDAYKPTPLIAPINGEVIVSTDQPGQTVTVNEAVIVISDHLIVKAQVDETDIGRVRIGQRAKVGLDAYPEVDVAGVVEHVSYESKVVNNVTTYEVYIAPDSVPEVFRSGMSATIEIVENSRENVLTLPIDAVKRDSEGEFVELSRGLGKEPARRAVTSGLCDERNCEILSGLSEGDKVIMTVQKYQRETKKNGSNPFLPTGPRSR